VVELEAAMREPTQPLAMAAWIVHHISARCTDLPRQDCQGIGQSPDPEDVKNAINVPTTPKTGATTGSMASFTALSGTISPMVTLRETSF